MLKQTPKTRVLFVRRLTPVMLVVFGVFYVSLTLLHAPKAAYAAASSTINFQARLQTKAGGIVPDGDYNVEFKLYDELSGDSSPQGNCGADTHCLWFEHYTNTSGPGGTDARIEVVNGYLTVQLGSLNSFGTNIDWTQNLWLTMNIGGTGGTPSWDGEMNPRLPLTAIPYAFTAGQLQTTNGSNTSKLSIQAPTGGNQTFVIQDQGAAGTYDLLTQNEADASYVQLNGTTQSGDIDISGTASSDSVATNSIDTMSAGPLAIGGTNASTISIGSSGGNTTTTINGSAAVKSTSGNDSATAFQVQNSGGGTSVFDVDTANNRVGVNINAPTRTLDINTTDDTGSAPPVLINQQGAGDADIELKTPNQSFYVGVDSSDNSTFKISSSAANGTLFTMGLTTQGANLDNGSGGYVICQPMTPDTSGTVTGVSVEYGPPLDSVNNKFRLALFGDTLGLPSAAPIAESGEGTIAAGWNNISLAASVTAGTHYWLCVQSNTTDNSKNNLYYNTGAATNAKFLPQIYPSWPTSGWSNGGAVNFSLYATIAPASAGDSFAASLFSLTNTGAATFQNSVNSAQALQVQNATGTTTVLDVNTVNGRIGINTSAPSADLSFGAGADRTIVIETAASGSDGNQLTIRAGDGNGTDKNGGDLLLQGGNSTGAGAAGSVIVRSQADSLSAFQIQTATGSSFFTADSANRIINTTDLNVGTAAGTHLFSDGFEGGSYSLWDIGPTIGGTSTATIDSTTKRNGTYSAKLTVGTGDDYYRASIQPTEAAYARAYVYVAAQPSGGSNDLNLFGLTNDSDNPAIEAERSQSNGHLELWDGTATPNGTVRDTGVVLPLNTWHKIEIVGSSVTGSTVSVYLDGTLAASYTAGSRNSGGLFSSVRIGDDNAGGPNGSVFYVDDLVVDATGMPNSDSGSLNVQDSLHVGGSSTLGQTQIRPGSDSVAAFQVQNASGASLFTVDSADERVYVGPSGGDTTGAILVLGIKTNSGDPTTEVDGAMYYNSNMGSFRCGQGGVWQSCIGGLLTSTTQINNTVTATASETALGTTYSLPANYCANGRTLRLTMYGTYQSASGAKLTVRTKIGGNTVATNYTADTFAIHNQDSGWSYTGVIICPNAAGSNATVSAQGLLTFGGDANRAIPYTITNSVNTGSSNTLSISVQWDTNNAANIFTLRTFMLESLGP